MSDYINDTHDGGAKIRACASELLMIGKAFAVTGNMQLSDDLFSIYDELMEAEEKISRAIGKEINDQCRRSEEASRNMVSAALAACMLTDENTEIKEQSNE